MRRAAGQAIICEALMGHIFRPFYVPDTLREAADQMLDFFAADSDHQLTYRHQVNTLLDSGDMEVATDAAFTAGDEIFRHLDRLIAPEKVEGFHQEVDTFLSQATEIWASGAQRAADRPVAMLPAISDEGVEAYADFGERNHGKAASGSHNIAATLFPRIVVNGKILHGGTVLWSDSPAIMIARDQNPTPILGRSGTLRKHSRRNSVAERSTG